MWSTYFLFRNGADATLRERVRAAPDVAERVANAQPLLKSVVWETMRNQHGQFSLRRVAGASTRCATSR